MRYKILITAVISIMLMLTTSCSSLNRVFHHPYITQGNYLAPEDILKIHIGMTQQQVAYILGTTLISDPFDINTNTWFYIFRQQLSNERVTQQILILTFNNSNVLIDIDYKLILLKQ